MTLWKKFSEKWLEKTLNHYYLHIKEKEDEIKHFKVNFDNCELCKQFSEILIEEKLNKIPIVFLWDQFHSGVIE